MDIFYGYVMDMLWIFYGYVMDILWIFYGYFMDIFYGYLIYVDIMSYRQMSPFSSSTFSSVFQGELEHDCPETMPPGLSCSVCSVFVRTSTVPMPS